MPNSKDQPIPRRPLARSGASVSVLAMGGHHICDMPSLDTAVSVIHAAIDCGITTFDNAWEYYNGRTEAWLGRALRGRRDGVFLITKVCTHGRSGKLGMEMLEQSLRRLQTDHLDLWQIHAITYANDPDLAFAPGGVVEALDAARRQGKTRFVGFTGHKNPAYHLRMIELADRNGFHFDTVQMPLNPFDRSFLSFERDVLPEVNRRGIAALGMKPMAGTADAVHKGVLTAEEMLRYAMSLPVATTIAGIDSMEVLRHHAAIAQGFSPLTAQEMDAIRSKAAPLAADGRFELYKGSLKFDNPETRRPHGFPVDAQQKEIKDELGRAVGVPGSDPARPG